MRRKHTPQQARVTVGWVETWSTPAAEDLTCRVTPITQPRLSMHVEDGHYRWRERKQITPPEGLEPAA